jgi:hydrocephalus-inducing protein
MFSIWTPLPEAPRPLTPEEGQPPAEENSEGASAESLPPMTKD